MQKYLFGLSEDRHQVPSLVGKYYNSSCQKFSQGFARKFHKFLPESFKQESFIYLCGVGPGEQGVGSA